MIRISLAALCLVSLCGVAAEPPQAEIRNRQIRAKLYLPDAQNGFYKSTRFDWSGVIGSLEFEGHSFYGPWFARVDPSVRDVAYQGSDIAVGLPTAMVGPVEEFQKPLGYDSAKPGGTFVKVGVGVLRRIDDTGYQFARPFELVDSGKWTVNKGDDFVTFTQEINAADLGYAYVYTKTVRLAPDKADMVMEHSLRNTGRLPIATNVYDHNFLVMDKMGPGPWYTITVPFEIKPARAPSADFAVIHGNQVAYLKPVENEDRVAFGLQGFGNDAKDFDVRIENSKAGAGVRIVGDRPLTNESVWSIRSVLAVEPFIDVAADPGKEFTWKYTYTYYSLPKTK
jgi:hypothetical protein